MLAAHAQSAAWPLEIAKLPDAAEPSQVIGGGLDHRFVPVARRDMIEDARGQLRWWRITPLRDIPPGDVLVLGEPFLERVEAWRPGQSQPSLHAVYGVPDDPGYAPRGFTIALPEGVLAGQPIYLRIRSQPHVTMTVQVVTAAQARADDHLHLVFRSAVLSSLAVLILLGLGFWAGMGERSFAWLALTLLFASVYTVLMGGEARLIAGFVQPSPFKPTQWAILGAMLCSIPFLRAYLGLRQRLPVADRALAWWGVVLLGVLVLSAVIPGRPLVSLVNQLVVLFGLTVIVIAGILLWWRERPAMYLLVSWCPLLIASVLLALDYEGVIRGPGWMAHLMSISLPVAGLLLLFGSIDSLLQLRRERDAATRRADHDALTDAWSRAALEKRLDAAMARVQNGVGGPLSMLFIDIDHFKQVNDRYGHAVGDACLQYIALRIRHQLRDGDMLGRWGGDELVVVMPDADLAHAHACALRLRDAVSCRPLQVDEIAVPASLSIGVAQWLPGESRASLVARADALAYASKASGRNAVSVGHGEAEVSTG